MKLILKHKIIGLALISALLPVLVMIIITTIQKNKINDTVIRELDRHTQENIAQIAEDIYGICETTNDLIQRSINHSLNVAREVLNNEGGVSFSSERVNWTAVNQFTKKSAGISLGKMMVGGRWLGQNRDLASRTMVIDKVKGLVGGTCTIFQRMNENGDMLRIATNVETLNKKRAIGTYIPAVNPDGNLNEVISSVLRGETYHGRAYVVNAWYVTAYEPIVDRNGRIAGILYFGIKQETVESLRKAIYKTKVGRTGYVCIIGGSDSSHKGHYVISKNGERDGESIWDSQDDTGKYFIRSIVEKALKLDVDGIDYERYPWKNLGEEKSRQKVMAIKYFKPWDWVIGATTYEDDYYSVKKEATSAMENLLIMSLIGGVIILGVAVSLAMFLGERIVKPIVEIISVAQEIAKGNLFAAKASVDKMISQKDGSVKSPAENEGEGDSLVSADETFDLLLAINQMTQNLNSLVGQVQRSGIQVTTSTTEIAASARQLEATVSEQAASTNQVVATSKGISSTSRELEQSINELSDVAINTAGLAAGGRTDLEDMGNTIHQLMDATGSISSKLSMIREKANNIDNVITTINKVADQTNLLSLNAAIEAEKAGEYGLGFSVVAREIRRLADQTAVSTLDIEHMVKEMQSAVSSGVMEMDKFTEEVRFAVDKTGKISGQLEAIIEQVQALTPRVEDVNSGMQLQSQSAQQISEAMVQLNETIQQTSDSLREFNNVTEQLNGAARGLQNEVSNFKVSE